MGQAVDLPDPLESPAAPAAAHSADDLLSQLAGDEIDRLLAESDAEIVAQEAAVKAEAAAATLVATPTIEAPAPTGETHAAAPIDEQKTTSLDQVLAEAVSAPPAPLPAAPTETPAADAPVDAKKLDESLASQPSITSPELQAAVNDIETTLQERSGLTDSTAGEISVDSAEAAPVPAYLKPLVWVNSPLMLLPEPIRDAVGKIAILTLFNSVALLAYVMIFRRHHH